MLPGIIPDILGLHYGAREIRGAQRSIGFMVMVFYTISSRGTARLAIVIAINQYSTRSAEDGALYVPSYCRLQQQLMCHIEQPIS